VCRLELSNVLNLSNNTCTSMSHLITLPLDDTLRSNSLLFSSSLQRSSVTNIYTLDAMLRVCFVLYVPRIVAICYSPSLSPPLFNVLFDEFGRSKLAKSTSSILPQFS
jgi:hypothetical protein